MKKLINIDWYETGLIFSSESGRSYVNLFNHEKEALYNGLLKAKHSYTSFKHSDSRDTITFDYEGFDRFACYLNGEYIGYLQTIFDKETNTICLPIYTRTGETPVFDTMTIDDNEFYHTLLTEDELFSCQLI